MFNFTKVRENNSKGKKRLDNAFFLMGWINKISLYIAICAILLTIYLLTYSAISRYFFNTPTDWQDEVSVFLLIGATFLPNAFVQSLRGHIGIEFLEGKLPPRTNTLRHFLIDFFAMLFCAFFSWKSWTLFHESVIEKTSTNSTWGSPLWIPYCMMAIGMTLLSLQLLLQVFSYFYSENKKELN
jgi:TRAP-type C4-dicarboxylate transport system permease small subunit